MCMAVSALRTGSAGLNNVHGRLWLLQYARCNHVDPARQSQHMSCVAKQAVLRYYEKFT